jgi:hypothetical protein
VLLNPSKQFCEMEDEMNKGLTFSLQALLVRHEAYMVDAERDRMEMSAKIEKLETDKRELEEENAKTIKENRGLLDQLEGLNSTVTESDAHIKSLDATLHSTHQEIRRLEGLASRTHELEDQLAALEQEQDLLRRTIVTTQEEERSAIQRWKTAERRLQNLQDQLERIEREAREERARHVEVLGRMERQRAVERELDTAAGRLKGAAASTAINGKTGSQVVSHFVRDILQDNANLQLGIVELREMLINSNDEVEALREQLLNHQPMHDENGTISEHSTLRAELAPLEEPQPQVISQELHIHHHYHGLKKEDTRRTKKKRASINASLFTPPKSNSKNSESASTILSQTSVTVPTPIPNSRWSVQSAQMSDFAPSSVPSSPQSMYRNSTLFDRGFDIDSSRPTSPGSSIDPMSPQIRPYHRKRGSEVSTRSFVTPLNFQSHVIKEEDDNDVGEIHDLQSPDILQLEGGTSPLFDSNESDYINHEEWTSDFDSKLRRSASHESILSISGLDIHTLKSRPSQLRVTEGNAMLRSRPRLDSPTSVMSVDTLTSSSLITASPTLSRHGHDSTTYLRSSIRSRRTDRPSNYSKGNEGGLGKKVGGWVFGRWGASPTSASESEATPAYEPLPIQKRIVSAPPDPLKALMARSPGINQAGPIPGFVKKSEKAPSKVTTDIVDHDALKEILLE